MISSQPSRFPLLATLALTVAVFAATRATAEEITLQNGQKVVGAIVGFENGMFKVETEFGFALIRRDRVRSITFNPASINDSGPKTEGRGAPAVSLETSRTAAPSATAAAPVKPPPPPVSRPLSEPLPAEIREHVEGFNYINDTFHFAMYKPPGWKIHENVPRETGRAIVAIGPEDEQTLLIVDRQVWSGEPDLKSATTEAGLRHTYENYQALSESAVQVAGRPALRRDFKGLMEGAEWHGMSVRVAQGNTVFGIIGLTSAETYQFQQALLNKIINSFRFIPKAGETPQAR
ncbi:MAG: hypothetical protein ACE145_03185 [Terriglobia bacterium]